MIMLPILLVMYLGVASPTFAKPVSLQLGESFAKARVRLYTAGWRADPRSHFSSGDYMGVDRLLIQAGYMEVDYCSVGASFCTFQYIRGETCLRLQTQGEQIRLMKVKHWTSECREREAGEPVQVPPADIRYLTQWKRDCGTFGQCRGIASYFLKLKRKYSGDREMMKNLRSFESPD